MLAATLANFGVCPMTGDAARPARPMHALSTAQVFHEDAVRDLLATMYVAGMDVNSGEFAFKVGFPAKSSLAGVVLAVVPGVMGVVTREAATDRCGTCNGVWWTDGVLQAGAGACAGVL